jgi:hypothetical protein
VVYVALLSLVLLSRSWSRSQQPGGAVAKELVAPDASPAQVIKEQQPDKASVREQHDRSGRKPGFVRALARRQAAMVAAKQLTTRNAISISRWQSPTAGFLRSQSDELFRSLPQLNQSLREMESFLPNRLN